MFSGEKGPLCRLDTLEGKTYGRRSFGWLWRGKHGILDSFWGSLRYGTLVFENKNAIGLIPMALSQKINFNNDDHVDETDKQWYT